MTETTKTTGTHTRGTGATTTRSATHRTGRSPEERAAEVEALAAQLNDAVAALTKSEAWLGMLRVAARFTRYRVGRNGLFEVREWLAQLSGRAAGSSG